MKVVWLTDIHLDFLDPSERRAFYRAVAAEEPSAVLVGGDIAEGPKLVRCLLEMERSFGVPIYFVLGNHDFYGGSIAQVRSDVVRLCEGSQLLHYLPKTGAVALGEATGLLGHDSWADGRYGDYEGSNMILNDYFLIRDFALADKAERLRKMQRLAHGAAAFFSREVPRAFRRFDRLFVLTHAPPFKEACWYQGRLSNDSALPHFASRTVGEVLLGAMRSRRDRRMTVLCGHTHGGGKAEILPNLTVLTGSATYGRPEIQRVFEVT